MDDKELQDYKQKLKGLSVKELNDILSHINKDKVPEKFHAVECEIALRSGAAMPAEPQPSPAPAPKQEAAKQETPKVQETPKASAAPSKPMPAPPAAPAGPTIQLRKSKVAFGGTPTPPVPPSTPAQPKSSAPAPTPAPMKVVPKTSVSGSAPAKSFSDVLLMAASVLFILGGVYFLLVPFINVPGAAALRTLFTKIPPHF